MTPQLESKLPEVGTTIFSVMSALAVEHRAINLGQGFPDFACNPQLLDDVTQAMHAGHNQYPPMAGIEAIRLAIVDKISKLYGHVYDATHEVTVTAGASQAIMTALLASIHPGDEVIVIEPAYDSYVPAIRIAGGIPVCVSMEVGPLGHKIAWDRVAAAVTPKTRMIMVNSPHNPSGSIFTAEDIAALTEIVANTRILILSDEVYEHMVYDGHRHESICRYPELAERSFVISSFGKTYHVTGWKVGYVVAPSSLMREFRKIHQFNVFTVNTPMQYAIAEYMKDPEPYLTLPEFYQSKRDMFRSGLANSSFDLLPASGTYFQCVRHPGILEKGEIEFCKWLTATIGVAAIPLSSFYQSATETGIVRFCFAKKSETLQEALLRLGRV